MLYLHMSHKGRWKFPRGLACNETPWDGGIVLRLPGSGDIGGPDVWGVGRKGGIYAWPGENYGSGVMSADACIVIVMSSHHFD